MRVQFSRMLIVAVTLFLASVGGRAILIGQAPASGGDPEAAKVPNPVPATPESIAAGESVFQRNCARCHGANAKGGQPVGSATSANLTDEKWDHGGTDGEIFNTIKNGVAPRT